MWKQEQSVYRSEELTNKESDVHTKIQSDKQKINRQTNIQTEEGSLQYDTKIFT